MRCRCAAPLFSLRRDRSYSGSRSVQFRVEIGSCGGAGPGVLVAVAAVGADREGARAGLHMGEGAFAQRVQCFAETLRIFGDRQDELMCSHVRRPPTRTWEHITQS